MEGFHEPKSLTLQANSVPPSLQGSSSRAQGISSGEAWHHRLGRPGGIC